MDSEQMETVAQIDKTNRKSTAKSWLAVLVPYGSAIFGVIQGVAAAVALGFARREFSMARAPPRSAGSGHCRCWQPRVVLVLAVASSP